MGSLDYQTGGSISLPLPPLDLGQALLGPELRDLDIVLDEVPCEPVDDFIHLLQLLLRKLPHDVGVIHILYPSPKAVVEGGEGGAYSTDKIEAVSILCLGRLI